MTEHFQSYPEGDAVRRHYAEEWERQIINAGGDENVAKQAVTLAALNGLFDPIGVAQQAVDCGDPRCTCGAIVNPNIPHARFCPLYSTGIGSAAK